MASLALAAVVSVLTAVEALREQRRSCGATAIIGCIVSMVAPHRRRRGSRTAGSAFRWGRPRVATQFEGAIPARRNRLTCRRCGSPDELVGRKVPRRLRSGLAVLAVDFRRRAERASAALAFAAIARTLARSAAVTVAGGLVVTGGRCLLLRRSPAGRLRGPPGSGRAQSANVAPRDGAQAGGVSIE